ncbi:MAG: hypothetical protein HHJ14_06590 [Cellulomonas sp.]|nr:hypothetical protein [Cellulomonas sp.]
MAVVILMLAWFVAISPTLATASDTQTQTEAQLSQNDLTRTKIDGLKKQAAKLDEIKAELAAMQLQIPTSRDQAEFQRQLDAIAVAHGVTIISLAISPAIPVVALPAGAATPAAAATPAPVETAAPTSQGATSTDAAPAVAPVGAQGFYAMSTSIDVVGTYQKVTAFLQDLQTGIHRLLLVSTLAATSQQDAAASGGRPATVRGDIELAITGSLYALANTGTAPVVPATAGTPPALPVPDPAKNAFQPVG